MQSSEFEFTDDEIDDTVKALYVTQDEKDFEVVFQTLDKKLNGGSPKGALTADTFRKVLPLVGENVSPEKVWFC